MRKFSGIDRNTSINAASLTHIAYIKTILQHISPMKLAKKVISEELVMFEIHFREAVKSRISLLDRIMQYIVKRKGKQIPL